jgi:type IV pilus assembly protein PilB
MKLTFLILKDAIEKGASEIHYVPEEVRFRIELLIDGELKPAMEPPRKLRDALIARMKEMAGLDVEQRRAPQDGRFVIRIADGDELEMKVSVRPVPFGEQVIVRLPMDPNVARA